jgi:predicted lysophospholipase L1 biosynthesis ABC-type transport system permease subunit
MATVYSINKGINKPIEFKGLKAQYIWYLGGGLLLLLVLFAILYIAGLNTYLLLLLIFGAGTALFFRIYRLSHKYGEYGVMKKIARRSIPTTVKVNSRRLFMAKTAVL